jgi:hypothetical protein
MTRAPQLVIGLVACLVIGAGAGAVHRGAVGAQRGDVSDDQVPLEYLPSVDAVLGLSLGHRPALADWFWVRAVLYFAGELEERHRFEWLREYLDLIVSLDPEFIDVYRWGGTVLILRTEKVTVADVKAANEILERGAVLFPSNWQLPQMAASNCSYYVAEPTPEEAVFLDECRRKYLAMAAMRPGVPFFVPLALAALEEGRTDEMCGLLVDVYLRMGSDPVLRQQIERRVKGGVCKEEIDPKQLRQYQEQFGHVWATTYPYLDSDLLVHVLDVRTNAEVTEKRNE